MLLHSKAPRHCTVKKTPQFCPLYRCHQGKVSLWSRRMLAEQAKWALEDTKWLPPQMFHPQYMTGWTSLILFLIYHHLRFFFTLAPRQTLQTRAKNKQGSGSALALRSISKSFILPAQGLSQSYHPFWDTVPFEPNASQVTALSRLLLSCGGIDNRPSQSFIFLPYLWETG